MRIGLNTKITTANNTPQHTNGGKRNLQVDGGMTRGKKEVWMKYHLAHKYTDT